MGRPLASAVGRQLQCRGQGKGPESETAGRSWLERLQTVLAEALRPEANRAPGVESRRWEEAWRRSWSTQGDMTLAEPYYGVVWGRTVEGWGQGLCSET